MTPNLSSQDPHALQLQVPEKPEHLFLFGAGASFGSDGSHLLQAGQLPPLGKDLFNSLHGHADLSSWREIPEEARTLFASRSFEEAMDTLDQDEQWTIGALARDLDLSSFFSTFRPKPSNLYWRLARQIARSLKHEAWTGAAVTLNYERLLEESFMRNEVFTVVKGVTFYDDRIPPLRRNQLFELCYPHGACQFFIGQDCFGSDLRVEFVASARWGGNAGVTHLLIAENIPKACQVRQIPVICRYQGSKRPSVNNYFIDGQRQRMEMLLKTAKTVTIIGIYCQHPGDPHIWSALRETAGKILYVNPDPEAQDRFANWASECNKSEGKDYRILHETFKDAFPKILTFSGLVR